MTPLLLITGSALIFVLIQLAIGAILFYLLNWFIGYVGVTEPFLKVCKFIIRLAIIIIVINVLLSLVGYNFIH